MQTGTEDISYNPNICPVRDVLGTVGDKWTLLVIKGLRGDTLRFSALRRLIPDISQRMLTQTLRKLERDSLISRAVTPTIPPRVEYALTPFGLTLLTALDPVIGWANANRARIARARAVYDATGGASEIRPLQPTTMNPGQ